jgi:hypothetical protein
MSILLRNRITGITTSTDLFGEDLALFLREYPDLVKVGIGTTTNQPYYILLNETTEEFRSPYVNNGLSYNPSTGTLSTGVFSGNGSGLSNVTAIYATIAGIATNAVYAGYATTAGIATNAVYAGYATTAGIATNVTTNANLTGHVTSVGNAAVLGSFTSLQLLTALTDETGTGANVFATSPTLVTPALGTPSSGNLANCTFPTLNQNTSGNAATVTTNANLTGHVTSVGNAAVLGSFTSLQLLTALTDETGTGANVFATSPTLVTPALGTPSSGTLTNCTDLNASQLSTGTVPTARLASGTANSSTYLRGDQTWQSISAPAAEFASGTTIVFYQASAPTGWTKSTSHDNKALRVVSGTGGGSGGSSSFTSVFASRGVPLPEHNHSASSGNHDGHQHSGPTNSQSINHDHSFTTGNQSANHTHTFTTGNQNADHSHAYTTNAVGDHNHLINGYITSNEAGGYGLTPSGAFQDRVLVTAPNGQGTTYAGAHSHDGGTGGQSANHQHGGTTAGMSVDHNHSGTTSGGGGSHSHDFTTQSGGSHNHSISISNNGTASASMDFAVQYIDVIICSKN